MSNVRDRPTPEQMKLAEIMGEKMTVSDLVSGSQEGSDIYAFSNAGGGAVIHLQKGGVDGSNEGRMRISIYNADGSALVDPETLNRIEFECAGRRK